MKYFELVPHAFKKFSVKRAFSTGVPTVLHYARRRPLPASDKPSLFTMNIMPPMMTVWHHFVKKNLGDAVDTVIFDCSGALDASLFPEARVQKFLNLYAATKTDEFLYHIARNRKLGWMCDDDMFLMSSKCINLINATFTNSNVASLSFRPRTWWHFDINGKTYEPSSSYCTVINRDIYCNKEKLCLSPCDGNTSSVSHIGKEVKRYDTFDHANEQLIRKGYECVIAPEKDRDTYFAGFSGVSSAVMMLWHFKSDTQMLEYLHEPKDDAWRGNTLFTIVTGLLAIQSMQKLHEVITGKPYILRAMPSQKDLEDLITKKTPLLRKEHSFEATRAVASRLKQEL